MTPEGLIHDPVEVLEALEKEQASQSPDPPPQEMTLQEGSVVAMDCRVFHYGSANVSNSPRVLLNMTFQEVDEGAKEGTSHEIPGFTYHISEQIKGFFKVSDFLKPKK